MSEQLYQTTDFAYIAKERRIKLFAGDVIKICKRVSDR